MANDLTARLDGVEVGTDLATFGSGSALESISRGEIDIQISTAKRFPRTMTDFKRTALELATLDADTAASMFYSMPRGGKKIEGPSVRFAEVLAYSWGNLRVESQIIEIGETHLTAMGTAFDLQRNTAVRTTVKRRITDSRGKRYNDDMIGVTANAAGAIAFREAVFKIIPRSLAKDVYDQARRASLGEGTMQQQRERAIGHFRGLGVDEKRLLAALDRKGVDDLTVDDIIALRGLATAIKDGETSIAEAFPVKNGRAEKTTGSSDLEERLNGKAEREAVEREVGRTFGDPEPSESPADERSEPETSSPTSGPAGDSDANDAADSRSKEEIARDFDFALDEYASGASEADVREWTKKLFDKTPSQLSKADLTAAITFLRRGNGPTASGGG